MLVVLKIIAAFIAFAFMHSLCVRDFTKRFVQGILGEPFLKAFYRLFYSLFSVCTTFIAAAFIYSLPDITLFKGPAWFRWLMHLIQLSGLIFGLMTFRVLDSWEFIGARQMWRFIKNRQLLGDREGLTTRLITRGTYGIVRHPLYFAGLVIFTFEPDITRNWLTVSVLADLYFIYGAMAEEKRLVKNFGTEYREYMKRVPRFIPGLKG